MPEKRPGISTEKENCGRKVQTPKTILKATFGSCTGVKEFVRFLISSHGSQEVIKKVEFRLVRVLRVFWRHLHSGKGIKHSYNICSEISMNKKENCKSKDGDYTCPKKGGGGGILPEIHVLKENDELLFIGKRMGPKRDNSKMLKGVVEICFDRSKGYRHATKADSEMRWQNQLEEERIQPRGKNAKQTRSTRVRRRTWAPTCWLASVGLPHKEQPRGPKANPAARAYQKPPPKLESRSKWCEHMRSHAPSSWVRAGTDESV
ncbi:hypothetical protein CJ030_MR7G010681 [Morella rubra]|uniref:Uncharacterized protein n=1 Tax=Morella rubra TaxID=262757 RepID=A0A6A1V014_9ROSI|nr:hypothetical protein CJ030_MR7G010681 [Morella rubra]